MKVVFFLVIMVLVSACQSFAPTKLQVNGLVFENNTRGTIYDAQLYVQSTHGQVMCSVIESGNSCGTGFPSKWYQGETLQISWHNSKNQQFSEQVVLNYQQFDDESKHYRVIVSLTADGQFSAKILPFSVDGLLPNVVGGQ